MTYARRSGATGAREAPRCATSAAIYATPPALLEHGITTGRIAPQRVTGRVHPLPAVAPTRDPIHAKPLPYTLSRDLAVMVEASARVKPRWKPL